MHDIPRRVLLRLPTVLGVDLSITNDVLLVWLAGAITFTLLTLAFRRRGLVPRGVFQGLFDAMADYIQKEVARGSIGERGRAWAPFLMALFFFILFCNLLGMVPLPNTFEAATSNLSVTAGLAVMVFVLTVCAGIRTHGLVGFARRFKPEGVPTAVAFLVVPIEIISWFAKPVSLAIRLFANMLASHTLILVFVGLQGAAIWFLRPLPLAGAVLMSGFELFAALIQAFIFTMLTAIYIREATETHG